MSVRVLDAVFQHSRSKGSARLMLLAMADAAHDSGELTAYARSQSHLARKANIDGGTARRALAQLVELGEIEVLAKGDGRESSNYLIHLPGIGDEGVQDAPPARASHAPRERGSRAQGAQDAPPIIPSSPVDNPSAPVVSRVDVALDAGFDRFWEAYPRRTAKGQARAVWRAAVKSAGSMEAIVDAAGRYRDDPNREDRYTKHPATWLRGECWADPPLPARKGAPAQRVMDDRTGTSGRVEL